MRNKLLNSIRLEGRIYGHNLTQRVSGENSKNPGTPFINGTIDIALDEEGIDVVQVHYTYVTANFSSGKPNANFPLLQQIIEQNKTWQTVGKDEAQMVQISGSAIDVNDFISRTGEMVSAQRAEGGFINFVNAINPKVEQRSFIQTDMLITKATRIEEDTEKGLPERVELKGFVFNFRNEVKPVTFEVKKPAGMDYFEGEEPSEAKPLFIKVRGSVHGVKTVRQVEEESAFGEPVVREFESTRRVWEIDWADANPYDYGDDGADLTTEELKKMMSDREVFLADVKKRDDEYKKSLGATTAPKEEKKEDNTSVFTF